MNDATILGIAERVKSRITGAFHSSELDKLRAELDVIRGERDQLSTELASLKVELNLAKEAVTQFEARVKKEASRRALDIVHQCGVGPEDRPPPVSVKQLSEDRGAERLAKSIKITQ